MIHRPDLRYFPSRRFNSAMSRSCPTHCASSSSNCIATAQSIRRYLDGFLRGPEGAFYTSQDADLVDGEHSAGYFALTDQARRVKGIPRVDKHIYARENGWAAEALTQLAMASGDRSAL